MNRAETARVLAKCQAYDRRTVGQADVEAWYEALADVDYTDALAAVSAHFRTSGEWLMPVDVRDHARAAKRARERREGIRPAALALPGRCEADPDRGRRIAAGVAKARAAIRKPVRPAMTAEPSAMDRLRAITAGPQWPDPEREAS